MSEPWNFSLKVNYKKIVGKKPKIKQIFTYPILLNSHKWSHSQTCSEILSTLVFVWYAHSVVFFINIISISLKREWRRHFVTVMYEVQIQNFRLCAEIIVVRVAWQDSHILPKSRFEWSLLFQSTLRCRYFDFLPLVIIWNFHFFRTHPALNLWSQWQLMQHGWNL